MGEKIPLSHVLGDEPEVNLRLWLWLDSSVIYLEWFWSLEKIFENLISWFSWCQAQHVGEYCCVRIFPPMFWEPLLKCTSKKDILIKIIYSSLLRNVLGSQ